MGMAAFAKGPTLLLISKNREILLSYQEMKCVKVHVIGTGKIGQSQRIIKLTKYTYLVVCGTFSRNIIQLLAFI